MPVNPVIEFSQCQIWFWIKYCTEQTITSAGLLAVRVMPY